MPEAKKQVMNIIQSEISKLSKKKSKKKYVKRPPKPYIEKNPNGFLYGRKLTEMLDRDGRIY